MRITDIFRQNTLEPSRNAAVNKEQQSPEEQGVNKVAGAGEDTVSISTLSRQLNQVSSILADDELNRAARVAELKKQVENGTYSVSSEDVARSLISFARDTERE